MTDNTLIQNALASVLAAKDALEKFLLPVDFGPTIEFGINIDGITPYMRGLVPVDLMKAGDMRVEWSSVNDPSITLPAGSGDTMASEVGLDAGGWPTKVPAGKRLAVVINSGGGGFGPEFAGTYQAKFPAGLDWYIDSGKSMVRTAYDLAKGTATIVIAPNVTGEAVPRIIFSSYNGVANTFPSLTPDRAFTILKDGEDPEGFLTAKSLEVIRGLNSKPKGGREYAGILRAMTGAGINRQARAGVTYNFTRAMLPQNRLGNVNGGGQFTVEDQVKIAKALKSHVWICLADTNTVDTNREIAALLDKIVPREMRCIVQYSNEIDFNFGGAFSQTGDMFERSKRTFPPNGNLLSQYNIEMREKLIAPFESVFAFTDPRYIPMASIQGAQANYGIIARTLDGGDLWKHVKGICAAMYIGGGIGGQALGNYQSQGIFTKASRDKAGVDDAGFIDDLFVAQKAMSDLMRDTNMKTFYDDLDRYQADKGLTPDSILACSYEFSWQHYNMSNNNVNFSGSIVGTKGAVTTANSPPLRVGDILTGVAAVGTKVLSVSGNTFTVDISQNTSGTYTSGTNLYAQAVGRLLAKALRDPRAGLAQVEHLKWFENRPGYHCLFALSGAIGTLYGASSGSNWGMEDAIGNEKTDEPYRSVAAYLASR